MKNRMIKNSEELAKETATFCTDVLRRAITENGSARMILSTDASQFELFKPKSNRMLIGVKWKCFIWMSTSICLKLILQALENILKKDL